MFTKHTIVHSKHNHRVGKQNWGVEWSANAFNVRFFGRWRYLWPQSGNNANIDTNKYDKTFDFEADWDATTCSWRICTSVTCHTHTYNTQHTKYRKICSSDKKHQSPSVIEANEKHRNITEKANEGKNGIFVGYYIDDTCASAGKRARVQWYIVNINQSSCEACEAI